MMWVARRVFVYAYNIGRIPIRLQLVSRESELISVKYLHVIVAKDIVHLVRDEIRIIGASFRE